MKRTIRIFVFVLLLAIFLSGCNQNGNLPVRPPIMTSPQKEQLIGRTEMEGYYLQYLPERVENPEGLPVLKWVCLTEPVFGGGDRVWNEEAVHTLNRMLEQRYQPFRVQFVMLTMDHSELDSAWFTRTGVQKLLADADLIFGDMSADEMVQYLSPITEYVKEDSESSLINSVPHALNWLRATVEDEIYGIPAVPSSAHVMAWTIKMDALEKYGLNTDDFSANIEGMEALCAQIFEQNDGAPFLYIKDYYTSYHTAKYGIQNAMVPGALDTIILNSYQRIGSCFALDMSSGTPKVVYLLESELLRAWQRAILRFRDAGYVAEKANSAEVSRMVAAVDSKYNVNENLLCIPVGTPVFPYESAYGMVSGISATSREKESAATLLSLIAEDEEFRMQLFYGAENVDYTMENGYYSIITRKDGTNYSLDFLSPLAYFSGITQRAYSTTASPSTNPGNFPAVAGKSSLEVYRETLDHSVTYLPIVFDFSSLETELSQMDAIMREYFVLFTNNIQIEDDPKTTDWNEFVPRMDDGNYQVMLDEMEAAGSKKVLSELQRQLDAWLAANPDWNQ